MAKITYEDKEFLNKNENIADKNKVNDTDLNQIKEVVNNTFYAGYTETAISDSNEAKETGGYYTNANTTNLPINGSGGFLNVMYRSDDNITQVWTRYRDNQVFMRQFNSIEPSGWKEWVEISKTFSTDEQIIGKWLDGSNIYRKVVTGTTSTQTGVTAVLLSNVKHLISINGYYLQSGRVSETSALSDNTSCVLDESTTVVTYYFNNTSISANFTYNFILEYIKND